MPDRPAKRLAGSVAVRVKPGAARARVGGTHYGRYGPAVVIAVAVPAVDGRATEAARRALATALDLAPARVALRSGASSRDKLFTVSDPPADLDDRVRRLLEPVQS